MNLYTLTWRSLGIALITALVVLTALPCGAVAAPVSHHQNAHMVSEKTASAARRPSGARWPSRHVRYRDLSGYAAGVRKAVSWINRMPTRLRLQRARPGQRAQITLRTSRIANVGWAGLAYFPPLGKVTLNSKYLSGDDITVEDRADVIAHELLHAVGIPHLPGCNLMDPDDALAMDRCQHGMPAGLARCGPQRVDARAVARLYGGSLGNFIGMRCARRTTPDGPEPGPDLGPVIDPITTTPLSPIVATPASDPTPPSPPPPPNPAPPAPYSFVDEDWELPTTAWDLASAGSTAGSWTRTSSTALRGTWSITDSPNGPYADNTILVLGSRFVFNISGRQNCSLSFESRSDLEPGYDVLDAELNYAGTWYRVAQLTGWNTGQTQFSAVNIDAYRDAPGGLQLRFVLRTDASITGDGAMLDSIRVGCAA